MRTQMAAWRIVATLTGRVAASDQDAETTLTISAHLTDYANLSISELTDAQAHATAAFRAAGFDLVWSSAPSSSAAAWLSGSGWIDVRVVILSHKMAEALIKARGLAGTVLGNTVTGAPDASARIVYIFYDRIYRVAASHSASVRRGLGHIMAHEIGHALLGVNSHSDEGLMRATWEPWDPRVQTFTPSQVLQIRCRFGATVR
jgi:hypothetical protein